MVEVLKYLEPVWYFNLKYEKTPGFYFPDYRKLSPKEKLLIDFDPHYQELSLEDAAFQALKRGIVSADPSAGLDILPDKKIPVSDLYRFAGKYYHAGWKLYFFLIRMASLKNPIRETLAFAQSFSVKRVSLYAKKSDRSPENIEIPKDQKITVVLPTLNRYDHLKNILNDLSVQTIAPHEMIIVDQSDHPDPHFYDAYKPLPIKIIYQVQKGQWLARNEALSISSGDFILLADDDSRVQADWIEQHLRGLLYFKADISAGVSIPEDAIPGKDKTFFHWADEFDSGNAILRREVFNQIGLFDRAFDGLRMGDTEFGLRAYLAGLKSVSNPLAKRIHVAAERGGMRYWGSREAFKPISFFGARPDMGVLYLYQKYFEGRYLWSFLLIRIFISYMPVKNNFFIIKFLRAFFNFIFFLPLWFPKLLIDLWKSKHIEP